MRPMFKSWSETNKEAERFLKPDLGLRGWDELTKGEKDKIWHYLKFYFFDIQTTAHYSEIPYEYKFYGYDYKFYGNLPKEREYKKRAIIESISYLNENYKARSFAETFLKNPGLDSACYDFYNIFMNQTEAVVMELLSAYAKFLYYVTKNDCSIYIDKSKNESEEDFLQRKIEAEYKFFDSFSKRLNDVFLQFGIKYYLTRGGFVPRQEEKIINEIYEPVLSCLSHPKWKDVNKILSDAFDEYKKNTSQGYSNCVTNTVSSIEAFLQIVVNGKTGKGEISKLITEAQKKKLIPDDFFTQKIFENLESVLARQRAETGIAHPKKEYANEKNARLMLNLAMIFFHHCIQR